MKFRFPEQRNYLRLLKNFVSFVGTTENDRFFQYNFRYDINLSKIYRQGIMPTVVRIGLFDAGPNQKTVQIFDRGYAPEYINEQIQSFMPKQKDLLREKLKKRFKIFLSDFTKAIPNDFYTQLTRRESERPIDDDNPGLPRIRQIKLLTKEQIDENNILYPILGTNLSETIKKIKGTQDAFIPPAFELKKISNHLLQYRIDPAAYGGLRTNAVVPDIVRYDGVIPKSYQKLLRRGPKFKNKNLLNNIHLSDYDFLNHEGLPADEVVSLISSGTSVWVTVKETIKIPVEKITGDSFQVVFDLLSDENNLPMEKHRKLVPHKKFLSLKSIPVLAPNLAIPPVGNSGRNILKIKQRDEIADEINLYRRIVHTNRLIENASYSLVDSIQIKKGEGEKRIVDLIDSSNPTIYRAVALNSGISGGEFNSAVTVNRASSTGRQNILRRPNYLALSHETGSTAMTLFISYVVPGPVSLDIYRKDLTIHEQNFIRLTSSPILLNTDESAPIEFIDSTVKPYRIYEYECRLTYGDGAVVVANNNIVVQFTPLQNNIVNIETTIPRTTTRKEDFDIEFDITKDIILREADITKAFLIEQGMKDEFEDVITGNREKLQSLFFIDIIRFNLLTGQIEDFGIIDSLNFSDRKYGKVRNVSPPSQIGYYKYAVTAYARSAETLYDTITRDVTTKHGTYSLQPSKWYNPVTLDVGSVVTDGSLKRNHAQSAFTLGRVVDIHYVTVDMRENRPEVSEAKVSEHLSENLLVKWKIKGDINLIDHFIIVLETKGMRTVVGKAHNIAFNSKLQFVDVLNNGESGRVRYMIVPVYFDYSRGEGVYTNYILI
jgi:hypothetical protein